MGTTFHVSIGPSYPANCSPSSASVLCSIVGRRVQFYEDDVTSTIVGVMPQGLDYPRGTDFWAPLVATMPAPAVGDPSG